MSSIIIPGGTGTVLSPEDAVVQVIPSVELTHDEAVLLRAYKKFLLKYDLREALYCQQCWGHNLNDGCEAHVTDADVLIRCRCAMRYHRGTTY